MDKITLSYIITTRNKLPYLKEVMSHLLDNVQADEEIIVTDGASTDGTKEYLEELYKVGKIYQFVSEPDRGEAHGFNKGILMARGDLIKFLTDDDAFYYPGIHECKKFMSEHKEVDFMVGNIADVMIGEQHTDDFVLIKLYEKNFIDWLNGKTTSSFFCGLSMMARKTSIAYFGLFDSSFSHVDLEYSFRITHRKAKIAWNTSLIVIATRQQFSKSITLPSTVRLKEWDRINQIYNQTEFKPKESLASVVVCFFKSKVNTLKNLLYKTTDIPLKNEDLYVPIKRNEYTSINVDLGRFFNDCDDLFINYNSNSEHQILYKEQ